MFETLEPPEQRVTRRWPVLMFGTYGLVGLVEFLVVLRRHGLTQPFSLAIATITLVLSLVWLVMTLRSRSPLSSRSFVVRSIVLLVLLMVRDI
jgi:hypothetical protein